MLEAYLKVEHRLPSVLVCKAKNTFVCDMRWAINSDENVRCVPSVRSSSQSHNLKYVPFFYHSGFKSLRFVNGNWKASFRCSTHAANNMVHAKVHTVQPAQKSHFHFKRQCALEPNSKPSVGSFWLLRFESLPGFCLFIFLAVPRVFLCAGYFYLDFACLESDDL